MSVKVPCFRCGERTPAGQACRFCRYATPEERAEHGVPAALTATPAPPAPVEEIPQPAVAPPRPAPVAPTPKHSLGTLSIYIHPVLGFCGGALCLVGMSMNDLVERWVYYFAAGPFLLVDLLIVCCELDCIATICQHRPILRTLNALACAPLCVITTDFGWNTLSGGVLMLIYAPWLFWMQVMPILGGFGFLMLGISAGITAVRMLLGYGALPALTRKRRRASP